ncbi:unnamed protein product [Lactuca saligna]|uniref:Uncharacterized protein n=1 Tax=Lactuca saligna TaxID=75948 RepID=A0AA35YS95_LACSI|nr:unnamed protein product [Lactuca saligna]
MVREPLKTKMAMVSEGNERRNRLVLDFIETVTSSHKGPPIATTELLLSSSNNQLTIVRPPENHQGPSEYHCYHHPSTLLRSPINPPPTTLSFSFRLVKPIGRGNKSGSATIVALHRCCCGIMSDTINLLTPPPFSAIASPLFSVRPRCYPFCFLFFFPSGEEKEEGKELVGLGLIVKGNGGVEGGRQLWW